MLHGNGLGLKRGQWAQEGGKSRLKLGRGKKGRKKGEGRKKKKRGKPGYVDSRVRDLRLKKGSAKAGFFGGRKGVLQGKRGGGESKWTRYPLRVKENDSQVTL